MHLAQTRYAEVSSQQRRCARPYANFPLVVYTFMSGLIESFGSVTGLVVGLLTGVVWLFAAPGSKWPRRWLAGLVLVYLAATVHGHSGQIGVLTLGGASRVLEAARIFQILDRPWIVSSGGPPSGYDMIPESETMKQALVELGVPADRIVLESSSRVTRDEAVLSARMLRELGITSCIVVTSDLHMRRALASFRHEGLRAAPAVARDPLDSQRAWLSWMPTHQGMEYSQEVVHEYVGRAWYWWRGWT